MRILVSNNKGQDGMNREHRLVCVLDLNVFEITALLKKQNLPNIRAHNELAAINPRVAHKVGRNGWVLRVIFPAESAVIALQLVCIAQVVVLVDVLTRYHDDTLVRVAERNLPHDLRGRRERDLLSGQTLLLVPLPHDDAAVIAKGHQELFILLAKVC